MKPTIDVIVATHNRRDLTAACLSILRQCLHADTHLVVIDDCSTEYTPNDIRQWCQPEGITPFAEPMGVGRMAWWRLKTFLNRNAEYVLTLDNDTLVTPDIDVDCLYWYASARLHHTGPLIFSPYRSCCHTVLDDETVESWDGQTWRLMESIGGISMFMDRATGKHLLETIPEEAWTDATGTIPAKNGHIGWDWHVSENATCIAPHRSLVEHLGRFGGGVNGVSADKAVDFVGYSH